jgi:tetraprenyl-beta-curcumene synthase
MGATKETAAAASALGAYVITVLPQTRKELGRWRQLAEAIPHDARRRRALSSLEEKAGNVGAVAVFATLAPLSRRRAALRAIVPLQVAIDYLDTVEEAGGEDGGGDDGYLAALNTAWVRGVERLPACGAVAQLLHRAVERCSEGQRQTHAAAAGDASSLRRWAESLDPGSDLRWWELAAGAGSSVAAHALIAAAADGRTAAEAAAQIDLAYNPPIGALTVFLDDLVDRDEDLARGEHNYLAYYGNADEAAARLGLLARRAEAAVAGLPRSRRHRAILAGVAAFYLSAEVTRSGYGRPIRKRLLAELGPAARLLASWVRYGRRSR